jgi:hypothetical protein
VIIDAFRLINPHAVVSGREPRQTTSNIGHINKPSIQALIHGLNRHYNPIAVNYRDRKTEFEQFDPARCSVTVAYCEHEKYEKQIYRLYEKNSTSTVILAAAILFPCLPCNRNHVIRAYLLKARFDDSRNGGFDDGVEDQETGPSSGLVRNGQNYYIRIVGGC